MDNAQAIADLAHILSDATRVNLLLILTESPATVNDLTTRLQLDQPRVSAHLAILREAQLVKVERSGRQHVYRLTQTKGVEKLLDTLSRFQDQASHPISGAATREVQKNSPIRQSRTCYDHLAGVAGVDLLKQMMQLGWLVEVEAGDRPVYEVTEAGTAALVHRGVDLKKAHNQRRKFAYGCPDWTERQPHLGGALATAILNTLIADGYIQQQDISRAVNILRPLNDWLPEAQNA